MTRSTPWLLLLSLLGASGARAQVAQTPQAAQAAQVAQVAQAPSAAAPAIAAPAVQHAPVSQTQSGELALRFVVREPATLGSLVVRWSSEAKGGGRGEARVRRGEDGYAARLPASAVQPPAVRYWVVERTASGEERSVFSSAAQPQRVLVFDDAERRAERQRLERRGGHRSSLIASGEYVDFGDRRLLAGTDTLPDRYYRLEAGYAHAFLSTIEEVQLSLIRVRGEAGRVEPNVVDGGLDQAVASDVGIDYGRAMVSVQPLEWLRIRTSVLLGASQEGFEYGGGGAIVLGDPQGVNLGLSTEGLTTLGYESALRMGFAAAPSVPMGAAVEVSSFPLGDDSGVRLLYDVGYEFAPGSVLTLRGGYQARTSVRGGPAAALGVRYAF